jgi:mRNA interferase RelE/StbE
MPYHIRYKDSVQKDLRRMGRDEGERILKKIREDLALDPRQGIPLKGKKSAALWRYRMGDYRVIYSFNDTELWILVVHIAHRREVYRSV